MDLDNGIILKTLQTELIILMVKVTRIVGDLLSETNSLTEMVEAGKEVTTPTHETESNRSFPRSPQGQGRNSSQYNSGFQPRPIQANHSSFQNQRNEQNPSFTPYEQKFPQHNNQAPPNVVRFTTTDDCVNGLTDLCPLN